ncbi:3-dehydroquinate synthase, chloroplastic-like isoform X2 [Apium graveolens]|uniref:3-dehydroquinate synthase, chloroplastic-like isoform X2 n=1 Tax=Apium graveolens TaxID=4045 RepID=UPI003D7911D7
MAAASSSSLYPNPDHSHCFSHKPHRFMSGHVQFKPAVPAKLVMDETASPVSASCSRSVASCSRSVASCSRSVTTVEVKLGDRSYPICIGSGLLDEPHLLQSHVHGKRVLVVTNTKVAPLYLDRVIKALTLGNPNVSVESVILPDGEQYKNMDTLMKVYDKAIELPLDLCCTFVALGGGVIGDMCGYAAASFAVLILFRFLPLSWHRDPDALAYAIKRSCENKAEVVSLDEKESGLRATLNLGHTFGHVSLPNFLLCGDYLIIFKKIS